MPDHHPSDKVRLGIIGLGAQGSMYAKFIADGMVPNMEIGAIADIHGEKRDAAASEYGVPVYPDYQSLLASGDVGRGRHHGAPLPAPRDRDRRARRQGSTRWSRSRPACTPARSPSSTPTRPPAPS